jgi:putative hydrolase of HD superfamily
MNQSISTVAVVQRQLDAYNARDIDALMATYADDVEHFEFPSTLLVSGAAQVRERLGARLQEPNLHARLLGRTAMGNLVIDHELVTRDFPDGPGTVELIAMYEVQGEKIFRAWFKFGEKRLSKLPLP